MSRRISKGKRAYLLKAAKAMADERPYAFTVSDETLTLWALNWVGLLA